MYATKIKQKNNVRNVWYKKPFFVVPALIILLAGVVAGLEITDTTEFFHTADRSLATQPTTQNRTAGPETKGETDKPADPPKTDSPKEGDASEEPPVTQELKVPSGNFVSNHRPNLSGQPSPSQIQSVCITTPGATCTIVFIKNNEKRELPPQKTDGEGAAYWTWKLQDIGLTEGTWKVQAKATQGSQTKTADDVLALEVSS